MTHYPPGYPLRIAHLLTGYIILQCHPSGLCDRPLLRANFVLVGLAVYFAQMSTSSRATLTLLSSEHVMSWTGYDDVFVSERKKQFPLFVEKESFVKKQKNLRRGIAADEQPADLKI